MSYWFTADDHFGHTNIIKHTQRPFSSVEEMNEVLIERWNARVQPKDVVVHGGDIGWRDPRYLRPILDRLNGEIHLARGNHDKAAVRGCRDRFASISDILEVQVPDPDAPQGQQGIVICHYAMRTWNKSHWGVWHLYGHSHGSLTEDPRALSFDIGVDCWDFAPISYEKVKATMLAKKVEATKLTKKEARR